MNVIIRFGWNMASIICERSVPASGEEEIIEVPKRQLSCFRQTPFVQQISQEAEFIRFADIRVLHLVSELGIECYYNPKIRSIVPGPRVVEPMKKV